jgi:hypothetical protein
MAAAPVISVLAAVGAGVTTALANAVVKEVGGAAGRRISMCIDPRAANGRDRKERTRAPSHEAEEIVLRRRRSMTDSCHIVSHTLNEQEEARLTDELQRDLQTCICYQGYSEARYRLQNLLEMYAQALGEHEESEMEDILRDICSSILTTRSYVCAKVTLKVAIMGSLKVCTWAPTAVSRSLQQ